MIDMIELQGKINKDCKIFTDIIEESAIGTIYEILNDEVSKDVPVRIMPDVHQGVDIVIGFTMPLTDRVNPNHIGVDIGCGVLGVTFEQQDNFDLADVDTKVRSIIPMGYSRCDKGYSFNEDMDNDVQNICNKIGLDYLDVCRQVGSLGGGNHFIEFGNLEGFTTLFIHSGSRNFGKQVCDYHAKKAKSNGDKYLFGDDMQEYLYDMRVAQKFAKCNRDIIAKRILRVLDIYNSDVYQWVDTVHNYIGDDNIIRKGAVSAKEGEQLCIPMNMRDGVLLCAGKGNKDWNESAPHGAGRIYSRSKAKKELSMEQFKSEMDGIYSTSVTDANIDESPMAYKSMDAITLRIGETVEIMAVVKPFLNIKA